MAVTRRGGFSMEYAVMVVVIVGACLGMSMYVQRALAGRWRGVGDAFGHGRQYGCGTSQALGFAVTAHGRYGADWWRPDSPCGSDVCDPWNHCGTSPLCDKNECGYAQECGSYTGYGATAAEASQNARAGLSAMCPNCGGTNCATCCQGVGQPMSKSRRIGATRYLCITEDAARPACVSG